MIKRVFDIIFSFIGIIIFLPFFIFISICIVIDSPGEILFKQIRVGKECKDFILYKFRTMVMNASKHGLLTIGNNDNRVTRVGYYLRKYKLDELPQLFNVLKGDMSFVGPRPEVRKYVNLYSKEQLKVLEVKPGITDYASLKFINENELLAKSANPEKTYIEEIMQAKLSLNQQYIEEQNIHTDIKIIIRTLLRILQYH